MSVQGLTGIGQKALYDLYQNKKTDALSFLEQAVAKNITGRNSADTQQDILQQATKGIDSLKASLIQYFGEDNPKTEAILAAYQLDQAEAGNGADAPSKQISDSEISKKLQDAGINNINVNTLSVPARDNLRAIVSDAELLKEFAGLSDDGRKTLLNSLNVPRSAEELKTELQGMSPLTENDARDYGFTDLKEMTKKTGCATLNEFANKLGFNSIADMNNYRSENGKFSASDIVKMGFLFNGNEMRDFSGGAVDGYRNLGDSFDGWAKTVTENDPDKIQNLCANLRTVLDSKNPDALNTLSLLVSYVDIIDAEKFITPLLKPNLSIEDIRSIVGEQLADHIVEHVTENTNEGFPLDKAQQLLESAKNFSKNSPKYIKAQIILNIILEKGFKPPFNPAQKRAIDDIYEAYTNPNLSKAERKSIIANAAKQFGLTDADFAELEGRIGVAIETMPEEDKEIYGQQIRDTEGIAKQNQEVYQNMGWNKAAAAAGALADTCRNVINSLNTNQRNADNVQRAAAGLDATSSVNAPPPTPDMVSGTFTASQLSVGDVQSRLEAARKELGDTIEQIDAEQIEKNIESNKNFEKELSAAAEARLAEAETILTVASGNPRLLELATRLIDSAAQSTAVIKEIANSPDIRELDKQITATPNGTKKTEQQTRRNEVVQAKVRQTLAVQAEAMQEISRILNDTLGNDPNAEILKSGLFGYSKDVLIISQLAMTIKGRIEELQNIAKTIEDSSSQEWKNLQKTIETMATDYREFERAIKNYQMKIEEGRVSKKVKEDMEDIEFDLPADIGHRNNIPSRLIREAINDLNKSLGLNELGFRENVLEDLPEEIRAQVENEEHLPEILQQMAQNNPEKLIQLAMGFNGLNEKEKSAVLKALEHMDPLQLMALYQSYKSVLPEAVKNKIEQILGDKLEKDQEQPELVTA